MYCRFPLPGNSMAIHQITGGLPVKVLKNCSPRIDWNDGDAYRWHTPTKGDFRALDESIGKVYYSGKHYRKRGMLLRGLSAGGAAGRVFKIGNQVILASGSLLQYRKPRCALRRQSKSTPMSASILSSWPVSLSLAISAFILATSFLPGTSMMRVAGPA